MLDRNKLTLTPVSSEPPQCTPCTMMRARLSIMGRHALACGCSVIAVAAAVALSLIFG